MTNPVLRKICGRVSVAAAILSLSFAASAPALAQKVAAKTLMQNIAPAAAAPATLPPPDLSKSLRNIKPNKLAVGQVGEVMLGALGIHLEQTKIDDLRKSAGGVVSAKGDAGDATRYLCYTVETGRRLWLTSEQTPGHTINGMTIVAQPGVSGDPNCPQLAAQLTPMGMISNVAIGDKRDVVEAELGPAKGGEWVRYETCIPAKIGAAPAKRCTELALRYGNNRVLTMQVKQKTS